MPPRFYTVSLDRFLPSLSTLLAVLVLMTACQPETIVLNRPPTVAPFPTMTPGRVLRGGPLPTVVALPMTGGLANPATAMALANQPTPTPNYTACPAASTPVLPDAPSGARQMVDQMTRFLSSGGTPASLERGLRDTWAVLGDTGIVRADLDLTGEGTPDIIVTFNSPDDGGAIAILSCADGRYTARYEQVSGNSIPQIVQIGDMNFDQSPEVLYTEQACVQDEDGECRYATQLITWQGDLGRFVSLLGGPIDSETVPVAQDMDNDQIAEIVIRMDNPGSAATGPLRTGMTIYDWNGAGYVQSITQLDPPRFRIQIVHEADRALDRQAAGEAIQLYELALASTDLQNWQNGEEPILHSYALYRLLLAHAFLADDQTLAAYQRIADAYPAGDPPPVYVDLATTFWNALQVTNNLHSACLEVHEVIAQKPEAVDLLNRYGSRSPVYNPTTVCPF